MTFWVSRESREERDSGPVLGGAQPRGNRMALLLLTEGQDCLGRPESNA
jgi:hypothetical protein